MEAVFDAFDRYEPDSDADWDLPRGRDDLLLDDAVRIFEVWEGQKASRIERRSRKKKPGKAVKIRGPHADVDHETKKAVMDALSHEDLKAVGSDNPDIYIKSTGGDKDDDLVVIVRPSTHAKTVGEGRKHITNVHAREVLGESYREKLNVLKLTSRSEPEVWVLTVDLMENETVFAFVQHQVENSIFGD